jgi:hypothetical protein
MAHSRDSAQPATRPERGASIPRPEGLILLKRWKARAAARRERIRAALAVAPTGAEAVRARRDWIQRSSRNLAARRRWLEARLENVTALEAILNETSDSGASSDTPSR